MAQKKKTHLTTAFGAPVIDDNISQTAGPGGPILLQDVPLLEKLAHFGRERIPERVVHAKGAGAFGRFTLTEDLSAWTCADFLTKPNRDTELFIRFSTVAGEKGYADADRDPRGFAVKFYTSEGNYDLVGNNTPIFFIRDPMKFPDFIHSQKRRGDNNLRDPNFQWDFWSLTPEAIHQIAILFSDRGIPADFRHMHGFGSHAFMWYNKKGEYFWVKYHLKSSQGIKCLTRLEAQKVAGADPDHATRDLYASLSDKAYPEWEVQVQILGPEEVKDFDFDPFDVTKVWPHAAAPLKTIGKIVLDKAPGNFFQDVEQAAFNPSSFVPGIGPSPDKLLQGRLFSYHDTHLHRLGANYHQIPVNRPRAVSSNNQRDGYLYDGAPVGPVPNFWPNSFDGPSPKAHPYPQVPIPGPTGRYQTPVEPRDYAQAAVLYKKVFTKAERERFLDNVAAALSPVAERIKLRSLVMFWKMDPSCAANLAKALKADIGEVEKLSGLSQEKLVEATKA
jgi:catalase